MQTRNAVLAAHLLLQSAEAALPKQKKNLAVAEYKNAMIAHKRRTKARQEEKGIEILLCVCSYLNIFDVFRSLSVGDHEIACFDMLIEECSPC